MISRIDVIGQNGPTGDHYEVLPQCYGDYRKKDPEGLYCNSCVWVGNCFDLTQHVDALYRATEKKV